jgi:hypothetical protein
LIDHPEERAAKLRRRATQLRQRDPAAAVDLERLAALMDKLAAHDQAAIDVDKAIREAHARLLNVVDEAKAILKAKG